MSENSVKRADSPSRKPQAANASARGESAPRGPAGSRGEVRERILNEARQLFSEFEFSTVTVREIAKQSECDPGLISYYFGSKIGLFREAMFLPADPVKVIQDAFEHGGRGTGERVLLAITDLWETSSASNNFRILGSSLLANRSTFEIFRDWLETNLLESLAVTLPGPHARLRLQLAFGQVMGVCTTRYLYGMAPLATMTREELSRFYGPHVDATLAGIGLSQARRNPSQLSSMNTTSTDPK